MNLKHLRLISIIALFLFCLVPVMGQDATSESTAPVLPTDTIAVISGEGEGDTIVNVGGETPAESDPTETPAEPMPWWAVAALEFGKLVAIYLTVVHGARVALQAFMNNPARVTAAENAVNLVKSVTPDALEEAARIGAEKAYAATRELIEDLRRAAAEITDGVPAADKPRPVTPPSTSSLSGTGGTFDSSAPRMP